MNQLITHIMARYGLEGETRDLQNFGSGHIHRTFKLDVDSQSYILQQFNRKVFPYPERITSNLDILNAQLDLQKLPFLLPLPIPDLNGQSLISFEGEWYRLFPFVPGKSINHVGHLEQARLAAKAFGSFIHACRGIDPSSFTEVIPGFHDLSLRFEQFQSSVRETELVFPELKELVHAYLDQAPLAGQYQQYQKVLPLRITHNDTKINNLIFDKDFSKVNALIDLDTVMPGYLFYDFGDLVRTAACTEDESSQNWSEIGIDIKKYAALLQGFLEAFGGDLEAEETKSLPFGGEMMTYIMGLRFLTDYLNGNLYYTIHYPEQNFHRAKNQLLLLRSLQENRTKIFQLLD